MMNFVLLHYCIIYKKPAGGENSAQVTAALAPESSRERALIASPRMEPTQKGALKRRWKPTQVSSSILFRRPIQQPRPPTVHQTSRELVYWFGNFNLFHQESCSVAPYSSPAHLRCTKHQGNLFIGLVISISTYLFAITRQIRHN